MSMQKTSSSRNKTDAADICKYIAHSAVVELLVYAVIYLFISLLIICALD